MSAFTSVTTTAIVAMILIINHDFTRSAVWGHPEGASSSSQCESESSMDQCTKLADPLIKQSKNMFPTTPEDIDNVCRVVFPQTWSDFISCIKSLSPNCLTSGQRADFNRAVGDSINAVHKMCTNQDYQNAYLKHAQCIHDKMSDSGVCSKFYSSFVTQLQESSSEPELCCAHESVKQCVIEESKECPCSAPSAGSACSDTDNHSASHFAKIMLDNAFGFILKQCAYHSAASTRQCSSAYVPKRPRFDVADLFSAHSQNQHRDGSSYFPIGDRFASDPQVTRLPKEVPPSTIESAEAGLRDPHDQAIRFPEADNNLHFDPDDAGHGSTTSTTTASSINLSKLPWFPDSDIKDFDEFFKNTVHQSGLSAQSLGSSAPRPASLYLPLTLQIIISIMILA